MNTQKYYTSNPYPDIKFESRKDVLKGPFAWRMRTILRTLNVKSDDFKGKRVLDVGCGTGEKPIYYALHGANVDAIDQSEKSIKIAKEKAGKLKVNINFIKSNLFSYSYKPVYDYVFCLGVLHHTHHPREGFDLISNVHRTGRCCAVICSNVTPVKKRLKFIISKYLNSIAFNYFKRIHTTIFHLNV